MKKPLLTALILAIAGTAGAQNNGKLELHISRQPSPLINIRLARDQYTGLTGQEFTALITNVASQKVEVTGTLSAVTVCGNQVSQNFDVTIKPGQSKGGSAFLFDMDGLTGTVFKENCPNPQVSADPQDPKLKRYNRIKTVTITSLIVKTDNGQQGSGSDNSGPASPPTGSGSTNQNNSAGGYTNNGYPTNATQYPYASGGNAGHPTTTSNSYASTYNATMTRLNNQLQTNQAVYNAVTSGLQQFQQLHDEKVARERAEQQAEEERREQEQARLAEAQREAQERQAAAEAAARDELTRQWNADQQLLGKFLNARSTSEIPSTSKQVYYITYERSYRTGSILVHTYALNKYSDGTWMLQNDLLEKIKFRQYLNADGVSRLLGFFESKALVQALLDRVRESNTAAHVDDSFLALNGESKSAGGGSDFWNQ